jgi:hypothetical protein
MINPMREQDVFDKIEDISLLPSKYHHYFKKYPLQLLGRGEPRKISPTTSIRRIRLPISRMINSLG